MKKSNPIKTLLFALTIVLLFVSLLQKEIKMFHFKPLGGVIESTHKPKLSFKAFSSSKYQTNLEGYLKENFGFREPLIRFYNQYLWDFYGKTYVSKGSVSIGKDGWLYEPWCVDDYCQVYFHRYAEDADEMASLLSTEAKRIYQLQCVLEQYGTHLFVCLVPAKDLIYPEYLPEIKETKYDNQKKFSARFFNEQEYSRLGVNHLNLEQWFLQMKDTADFFLFPKTGTHWSNYACLYATDTLVRYMEHLGDCNLKNIVIGPRELDEARSPDDDLEKMLNLIRPLPKPKYYYAVADTDNDTLASKAKLITIGDSFWWNIVGKMPMNKIFSEYPFWYYNSTIYYGEPYHSTKEIDLLEELLSADFITLFFSAPQQYKMNCGFTERALLALCFDPQEVDSVKNSIKTTINNDPNWMKKLEDRAQSKNISLDIIVDEEVNSFIENNIEMYFPTLLDSVPKSRNPRNDELAIIKKIKKDSKWMVAMHCQATVQKLPLKDILKAEANNVLNNRPLMRDMTEGVSRETYIEGLVRNLMEEFRGKPLRIEQIKEKAKKNHKSFEEQLEADARWVINDKMQKGEIVWEEE